MRELVLREFVLKIIFISEILQDDTERQLMRLIGRISINIIENERKPSL